MDEDRHKTLLAIYWVIVAVGFVPLAWLAYDYVTAPVATDDTPIHITLAQPLFALVFVLLFLAAAAIAIVARRALLVVPALALLGLGVMPAYSSLQVTPERAGYEIKLQEDSAALRTDLGALQTRVQGRYIARTSCQWTGWVNGWDAKMNYVCPTNKFIVGAQSTHDNRREDRRWKFNCCALTILDK